MKKPISLFKNFGIFLLVYATLFGIFTTKPVAGFVNDAYRTVTSPLMEAVFSKAYLKLERDAPPESDIYAIRAVFTSKKKIEEAQQAARQQGASKVDLGAKEYDIYLHRMFTTFWLFLLCLIGITPISWKQKIVAVIFGTLLFYGFTVFKVFIFLADLFNRSDMDIYKLSATGGTILEGISYVIKSLGVSALVVVFIWILTAFRKGNWREILGKLGATD